MDHHPILTYLQAFSLEDYMFEVYPVPGRKRICEPFFTETKQLKPREFQTVKRQELKA